VHQTLTASFQKHNSLPNCFISLSFTHALGIDRVFRGNDTTREVYEAGAKEVALSVVSGINCKYDGRITFNTLFANN
jgi:centromeric protein E